jgi:hypothetical protein
MDNILQRIKSITFPQYSYPLILLILGIVSYGLLFRQLSFFWDDYPLAWISDTLGSDGLSRYFSTNRPVWGLVYRITTPILGAQAWRWQLFALFWHWISTVVLWSLLRLVWSRNTQPAVWISLIYFIYPGFRQLPISLLYSHFYIVLTAYFLSLFFTILAIRKSRFYWIFTLISLGFSAINLSMMEYFYVMELVRPVLIWVVHSEEIDNIGGRLKKTFITWIPYLVLFISVTIWRVFFFQYQTQNYAYLLLDRLREEPLDGILFLIKMIANSLEVVFFASWQDVFQIPSISELGLRTTILMGLVIVFSFVVLLIFLFKQRANDVSLDSKSQKWGITAIVIGLIFCLLAGWPFWLIELKPSMLFPMDRFTLPFILGVSLVIAGFVAIVPIKQWIKILFLAILVSLATGFHFQVANAYRRDGENQRRFFWQFMWRVPGLEPGTTIMANDLLFTYYSDNSLSAPLNWIYAPDNQTEQMSYMFIYPSVRIGSLLPSLDIDTLIEVDYLAAVFNGDTSQVVVIYYDPPGCMRVLDADLDVENKMLPEIMQQAAALSSTERIITVIDRGDRTLLDELFGDEPTHSWCYHFQKADLARQQNDWEKVVELGDIALNLGDYPNDPSERIPFIEGYAHVDNWERARELSQDAHRITPMMEPMLCRLWKRIEVSTPDSPGKDITLPLVYEELGCAP